MSEQKKYISLHVDIDCEGVMVLMTDDGRIVEGIKSMAVFTGVDELSTVNANIALTSSKIPMSGSITNGCGNGKVK